MDSTLEIMTDLERRIAVTISMPPLEQELTMRRQSREIRLGKSSTDNELAAIRQRLIYGVMHAAYLEAASRHGLDIIGTPHFSEPNISDDALSFTVEVAITPDMDTSSFKDIQITRPHAVITENDIDMRVSQLHGQNKIHDSSLRETVRDELNELVRRATRDAVRPQVLEALLARYAFNPPDLMIDTEFNTRVAVWQSRKANNPATQIPPAERIRFNATRAVRMEIILLMLIQAAGISSDDDDLRKEVEHIISLQEDREEARRQYMNNEVKLAQADWIVRTGKAIDWVIASATVTDMETSCAQLLSAGSQH